MKNKIQNQFFLLLLVIVLTIISQSDLFAQLPCPDGCTGPNCEFCADPSTIPLDSGVGFMLVSGIVLGIRKIYKKNQ